MNYSSTLTNLYYLITAADGIVNEKEVQLGVKMQECENIDSILFEAQLQSLRNRTLPEIKAESVQALKQLKKEEQIRCIAWICQVANADGFMDKKEWALIYNLYHVELKLPMEDIMSTKKEINFTVNSRAYSGASVSLVPSLQM